ncbi:MAG: alpha/beta hydrolase [Lentilitoribacter sp.]
MSNLPQFPTTSLIAVNDIELEVFEAGRQNAGKPIVLCHGWPEHAYSWRYQIPALVTAGYHVIVPNQRGFGRSSSPDNITDFDISHLTGDLVAVLDHYGYKDAIFVGHDWGANIVWSLAMMHPTRVSKIINFALPYQERGEKPWIEFMEVVFGKDFYFVHFNKKPGVADKVLDENRSRFLHNLFRKNVPLTPPEPGMMMINLAKAEAALGEPIMSEEDLDVFISAFETSGFTGGINWYRNLDRNWHILANVDPIITQPTLMIYGDRDLIPKSENLPNYVPTLDIASLDCGHWIQQEKPEETNNTILSWLKKFD